MPAQELISASNVQRFTPMISTQPASDSDASPPLASIIIANFNYSFFVADAIESALAVEWWPKEIIVVDDGSTDDSVRIIEGYIGRGVQAFRIENGGQAAAAEFGFYRSKGLLIMFLDSDDVVDPSAIREAVFALTPTTSKVQFQMRVIDSRGTDMNGNFPTFPAHISQTRIRSWL